MFGLSLGRDGLAGAPYDSGILGTPVQCSLTYKGIHLQESRRRFFVLFFRLTYKGIHLQESHFEILWCLLTHLYESCRRNFQLFWIVFRLK